MKTVINGMGRFTEWRGTASELAEVVGVLLEEFGMETEPTPTERLVRYYATEGVLTRPEKEGREAHFGFRQIAEFLAVRVLLADGWTLARIADFFRSSAMDALLSLLPVPSAKAEMQKEVAPSAPAPAPTRAEMLVQQFAEPYKRARSQQIAPDVIAPPGAVQKRAQTKQEVRTALTRLGMTGETPPRTGEVRFTLTPWCQLQIQPEGLEEVLRRLPDTSAQEQFIDDLTRVCRAAMEEEINRRRR